jgi:hypothetical protein
MKPLLKRGEKMSFHILKIAIKMFFSRHVLAEIFLTGFAGETGGVFRQN